MVDAARSFASEGAAIGAGTDRIAHARLRSFEGIVPKGTDWRTLGSAPGDAAPLAAVG